MKLDPDPDGPSRTLERFHELAGSHHPRSRDKVFGELAFRFGLPATCGIVLFRVRLSSPDYVARLSVEIIQSRESWEGVFAVVEETRIRVTSLPDQADEGPH